MVIAQCYQMGPATKVDPLAMIADAKRLANPSQLVGSPPPPVYSMGSYGQMAPPPPTASSASSSSTPASGPVITNAGSFIMPLAGHAMPPPAAPPQSYYPAMYATAAGGYPRAPYYPYAPQPAASYYPPPSQPVTTPVQSSPPPSASTTGTISTFNAATGTAAPGGQQGTWSEEETDRLRKLAEQSREMGGPQNKGEIEWDWVVSQWGNSRTRHQILLKATSMGLKESTTRGTKRRRETDASANENEQTPTPTAQSSQVTTAAATSTPSTAQTQATTHTHAQTTHAPAAPVNTTAQSATTSASPALAPQRPPSSSTSQTIAPARTAPTSSPAMANARPWPMPTVAANTPSPVLASAQTDRNNYYRPPPTQTPSYGTTGTTPYGTNTSAANTASYVMLVYPVAGCIVVGSERTGLRSKNMAHMYAPLAIEDDDMRHAHRRYAYSASSVATSVPGNGGGGGGQFASSSGQSMNQSPSAEAVQTSGSSSYASQSPVAYTTPHIYPNNAVPYVSSSLPSPSILPPSSSIYPSVPSASSHTPHDGPQESPSTSPSHSAGKRKQLDDGGASAQSAASTSRKRRILPAHERDESEVGPNGGPKHWTDAEKNSLFQWLLVHDKHWDMFRTKMNTVFREVCRTGPRQAYPLTSAQASEQIFGGRKSFTALKSCYHRNVETFKQIFAFETYLTRTLSDSDNEAIRMMSNHGDPTIARQAYLEQKLEDARNQSVPVGNLNVKVIDHWHLNGWYGLFKRRFREDPRTGQPVPFYGPGSMSFPNGPAPAVDPQLVHGAREEEEEEEEEDVEEPEHETIPPPPHPPIAGPSTSFTDALHDNNVPPTATPLRGRPSSQSYSARKGASSTTQIPASTAWTESRGQTSTVQALDRLTAVTQALVEQCSTLTELLRAEREERRERAAAMQRRNPEDGMNRKEKAALATEMLANADVGEESVGCLLRSAVYTNRGCAARRGSVIGGGVEVSECNVRLGDTPVALFGKILEALLGTLAGASGRVLGVFRRTSTG
ncbi:hypothetical protein IEO21_04479 [Rhodonia placenta]|uniref:Myb-like domain-containing protein n=1 Tax=Rhodonia placenta TaxID=104341 RepID=A0A8H7P3Q5_9APHY|nr:hypothetical protein IEO21_04479 [Postia placenta]